MENEITQEEIIDLMVNRNLDAQKFITAIVDTNNIIGVGLITLAQTFYLMTVYNRELRGLDGNKPEDQKKIQAIINQHRDRIFNNRKN